MVHAYPCSVRYERESYGATDARCGAGYDGDFVGEELGRGGGHGLVEGGGWSGRRVDMKRENGLFRYFQRR